MSQAPEAPRWRILVTPRWLGWHLFAVVAFIGMWWLGDWQFRRAMAGNTLSWAYTFEWPLFAIFGAVFWVKTVRDELHPATGDSEPEEIKLPTGVRSPAHAGSTASAGSSPDTAADGSDFVAAQPRADHGATAGDTELAEYNAYLAKLNKEVKGHGRWHGLR